MLLRFSILEVSNTILKIMLQHKSNKVLTEIHHFFSSQEKAISTTLRIMKALKIEKLKFARNNNWPEKYNRQDILLGLLLFPLFSIKNVSGFVQSSLQELIVAGKDTMYRFKNDSTIPWREIVYKINMKILGRIENSGTEDAEMPRCLIIDDTDLRKSGKHIEHVSKVWSHVLHSTVLGFKGLFLGYWDTKTFIGLDFSLHKEKGKNIKCPNGLSIKDNKKQFKKDRSGQSAGYERESELHSDKISNAIAMIQRAVTGKIPFEYVLMDSWFVCERMILSVAETGAYLLGMCKMGTAKYTYNDKERTAQQILNILKRNRKIRWIKQLHMYVAEVSVEYKGIPLKLFYCRNSKHGKWHLLTTTNTRLNIKTAYPIYSIRWSIEVFFKETRQYFQLSRSQSSNLDAQIADTSITMIQYNVFSLAKRFLGYETLGALFNDAKEFVTELTICKRLWACFMELISLIAEIAEIDPDEMIEAILRQNDTNKFAKLLQLKAA